MDQDTDSVDGSVDLWGISDSHESACSPRAMGTLDSCVSCVFRQFSITFLAYVDYSSGNLFGLLAV